MKKEKIEQNFQIFLKLVIISGIIEIIGLLLVMGISHVQKKQYENVINMEYAVSQNVSLFLINDLRTQSLCQEYSISKREIDYVQEIGESIRTTDHYLEKTESAMSAMPEDISIERIKAIYQKQKEQFRVCAKTRNYKPKNMEKLQGEYGLFQSYVDNEKKTALDKISILENITVIMNRFIVMVMTITFISSVLITNKKEKILQKKTDEIEHKASVDPLTGLWNRAYTKNKVESFMQEHGKGCLFMMDMDNFKKVNDTYGHIAGDQILKTYAKVLVKSTRNPDVCCRIGGDEFIVFAKNINKEQAELLAERFIYNTVEAFSKVKETGGDIVTVSIGAAMLKSEEVEFQQLYDRADSALYTIKKNGKNDYHFWNDN